MRFRINLNTMVEEQVTDSDCNSYRPMPGEDILVYKSACSGGDETLYFMDLATSVSTFIWSPATGNPSGYDFDGERWVVWDYHDGSGYNELVKYDILMDVGPYFATSGIHDTTWPTISDGKVYSGTWDEPLDYTNRCDVQVHDLASGVTV